MGAKLRMGNIVFEIGCEISHGKSRGFCEIPPLLAVVQREAGTVVLLLAVSLFITSVLLVSQ